uniref:Phospholipid scramblase n=1 Tax=Leptobrachium leishanense TaxID=445787 RepID=A0A8C5M0A8_9ANUR
FPFACFVSSQIALLSPHCPPGRTRSPSPSLPLWFCPLSLPLWFCPLSLPLWSSLPPSLSGPLSLPPSLVLSPSLPLWFSLPPSLSGSLSLPPSLVLSSLSPSLVLSLSLSGCLSLPLSLVLSSHPPSLSGSVLSPSLPLWFCPLSLPPSLVLSSLPPSLSGSVLSPSLPLWFCPSPSLPLWSSLSPSLVVSPSLSLWFCPLTLPPSLVLSSHPPSLSGSVLSPSLPLWFCPLSLPPSLVLSSHPPSLDPSLPPPRNLVILSLPSEFISLRLRTKTELLEPREPEHAPPKGPCDDPPNYNTIAPYAPPVTQPPSAPPPDLDSTQLKGVPPGLEYLTQINLLSVREKFKVSQGYGRSFDILDSLGQRLFQADEIVECCGPIYNVKILNNNGDRVMELVENCACSCTRQVKVFDVSGVPVAFVVLHWNTLITHLSVLTSSQELALIIVGPGFRTNIFGNVCFEVISCKLFPGAPRDKQTGGATEQTYRGCHGTNRQGAPRNKQTGGATGRTDRGCHGTNRQGAPRNKQTGGTTEQTDRGRHGTNRQGAPRNEQTGGATEQTDRGRHGTNRQGVPRNEQTGGATGQKTGGATGQTDRGRRDKQTGGATGTNRQGAPREQTDRGATGQTDRGRHGNKQTWGDT